MNALRLAAALLLVAGTLLGGVEVQSLTPPAALEMTKTPGTYIVDVRSVAEYFLIGHPVGAFNIPLTFWNEKEHSFDPNESFLEDIKARFKVTDVLIFICRSGDRSRRAAELALAAGFARAYNIAQGFEGEKDANGYRTIGGWKNSGLPYTYDIDDRLIYRFH
jgi:rhodanese-related sulfurtransferase